MLLGAGVCDVSVDCGLALIGGRVAVTVFVVDFVSVMSVMLCGGCCAYNKRNNYQIEKSFHF